MPDLDLGNIADVDLSTSGRSSTERAFAGYRLLACMAWPTDEARREQFLATVTARAIDWLDNLHLVEDPDDPLVELEADFEAARSQVRSDSFESEFRAHGGYGSVAAAPGVEAFRTILENVDARWRAAGTVLYLIMAIAQHHPEIRGGASVNKAVFLMECFVKGSQFPTNRKDLMAAWSAYKKVAHLCAAYVCMTTRISQETEPTRTKFIAGLFSQCLA
ncbi:MAG: hypothetical protein IH881_20180, partial [Myxococcales bacterium]|nr:hypothetical protein [Myxococcales bacterium]